MRWLGTAAVAVGFGAALATGAGIAHADEGTAESSASTGAGTSPPSTGRETDTKRDDDGARTDPPAGRSDPEEPSPADDSASVRSGVVAAEPESDVDAEIGDESVESEAVSTTARPLTGASTVAETSSADTVSLSRRRNSPADLSGLATLSTVAARPEAETPSLAAVPAVTAQAAAPPSIVNTISVGRTPIAGAITPNGKRVYVANGNGGTVSVIDTSTRAVIKTIAVGTAPVALVVNPSGSRIYVAHNAVGGSVVSVISTSSNTIVGKPIAVGSDPLSLAVSPNGKRVYVANAAGGTVSVIDATTNRVIGSPIAVGGRPHGVAVSPDGKRVYVAGNSSGTVTMIDTATNSVAGAPIRVGVEPIALAFTPDGKRLYVSNNAGSTVTVIDTATNSAVGAPIPVGFRSIGMAVTPNGRRLLVANSANASVSIIDTATNAALGGPVSVGTAPTSTAVSPNGRYVYVTNAGSNTVSVIDLGLAETVAATMGTPSTSTGRITGKVSGTDPGSLTFGLSVGPGKGTVTVSKSGAITYTPTSAARHAASAVTAGAPEKTDAFTVTVSNSVGVTVSVPITVSVLPKNAAPTLRASAGAPDKSTSVVTIKLTAADSDKDTLAYQIPSTTAKGSVARNADGTLSYTPTLAGGAQGGRDSFTVSVADGHGATTSISVTVTVKQSPIAQRLQNFVTATHRQTVGDGECVALIKRFLGDVFGITAGAWGDAVAYAKDRGTGGSELYKRKFTWHASPDTNFQDGDIIVFQQGGYNTSPAGHIGIWFQGKLYDQNSGWHASFDPGVQTRQAGFSPFWNNGNVPPYNNNGKIPVGYLGFWRK